MQIKQELQIPIHNAIPMVESTDEINMEITLDKLLGINPQLIYMDFIYINCIIKIILQKGALTQLLSTTPTTTINLRIRDYSNNAIG